MEQIKFIVTTHKYRRHESMEDAVAERDRLQKKFPKKRFHVIPVLDDLAPGDSVAGLIGPVANSIEAKLVRPEPGDQFDVTVPPYQQLAYFADPRS